MAESPPCHFGLVGCFFLVFVLCFAQCLVKTQTTQKLSSAKVYDNDTYISNNSDTLLHNRRGGRSLKCIPMLKHFEVELEQRLKPGEGVGLTGDHIKLGQWQVDKSLQLKARRRNPLKWFVKIPMCSAVRIYFRFFIYYIDSKGSKRIRWWEGQQHARVYESYEMYHNQGLAKFGKAYDLTFGGGVQKEKGWLRGEYIIQLKFIWPQHIRFTAFSHFIRSLNYNIKVKAFEASDNRRYSSRQDSDTEIEVSRFIRQKSNLRTQLEEGEYYTPGAVLVFHITTTYGTTNNLYTLSISSREGEVLGEVAIPTSLLAGSEGILELPIYDIHDNYRVGWLTLPFLKIEPMVNAFEFSMRSSFQHYWPQNWPTLDVGHRGVGKSFYYHSAKAIENTIHSFLKAYKENSDMVEMDIQLTKDYVPVVWNDCGFYTVGRADKVSALDLNYVYIHDLTYKELLESRVFVYMNGAMVELSHLNSAYIDESERIFPALSMVFNSLPQSLGIIIEVKWPQLLGSGSLEYLQSLDKNRYVDAILQTSMRHTCGRPLIFSSFDADICSMIRFKQPVFPTLLLTVGEKSRWESYADLRTLSSLNAIHFAQSSDILGTAIYAGEVSRVPQQINLAYQLQQVVFVWGDQLNNSRTLSNYRELEVAGVIYDQVNENFLRTKRRIAIFESPELKRIFLRQCVAIGNVTLVEGAPDTHSPFWPRFRSVDEL